MVPGGGGAPEGVGEEGAPSPCRCWHPGPCPRHSGQRERLQRKSKPDVEERNLRPPGCLKTFSATFSGFRFLPEAAARGLGGGEFPLWRVPLASLGPSEKGREGRCL